MPDFLFPHQSQDSLACLDQTSLSSPDEVTEADVLITAAIATRPAREPDLAAENQALRTLAQYLTEQPQILLKTLVNLALDLCQADSVGVSLLETLPNGEPVFRWVAIAGVLAALENTTIPGNFSPCGTTLGCLQPQLYLYPERYFTYLAHPQFSIVEGLVIPLRDQDRPLGTLWIITHSDQRHFDAEDHRLMMSLGGFTVSALSTMQQLHNQAKIALEQEQEAHAQYQRSQVVLSQSEELKQQILDSSDDCIKVLDLEGRILYMNPGGKALLGISDLRLLPDISWAQFWPGLDRQVALDAIAQARLGKTTSFQGYCPTFTGQPKWWDSKISPIRGANQQIEQLLCISRDITEYRNSELERKQAEADLLASEQRYRAIVNQAVTGVAYTNLEGSLILVNQKYCEITGYSAEELSQLRMQDFTHPDDLPHNLELYNRMLVDGTPFEIEKRYLRKDGSIVWVNNSVYAIRNAQGELQSIVAICLDITKRKQVEADLRAAQESLTIALAAAQMKTWY